MCQLVIFGVLFMRLQARFRAIRPRVVYKPTAALPYAPPVKWFGSARNGDLASELNAIRRSVETTEPEIQQLRDDVDVLRQQVTIMEPTESVGKPAVVKSWLWLIALAVLAAAATLTGAQAFGDPGPSYEQPGGVALAIQTTDSTAQTAYNTNDESGAYIESHLDNSSAASFDVYVNRSLGGREATVHLSNCSKSRLQIRLKYPPRCAEP